jgi:hypothetical protein
MKKSFLGRAFVFSIAVSWGAPAFAASLTLAGPFEYLDNRSSNDAGKAPGQVIQFGENSVSPNGSAGTTATATLGGATVPLGGFNQTINSNLFTTSVANTANNRGSWTLNFTNGADTAAAHTPTVGTALVPLPFVTNVSVSGTGLTPMINWTNTASALDAVAVRIRDNSTTATLNGTFSANLIALNYFIPTTHSFQVPTGLLTAGHEYSIEIDQLNTRTPFNVNASTGATFVNTLNQSSSFFDYSASPGSLAASSVFLPTVGTQPNGLPAYTFQIKNIAPNTPVFIDPTIAIGYSYKIGLGDPNFATVTLPAVQGTSSYTVLLPNSQQFAVLPGQTFDFTSHLGGGVSNFEVLGINPTSGLNVFDPNAFVTRLTFVSAGNFTGEMDPISVSAVPLPSTWGMMLLGLASLGFIAYRQKNGARDRASLVSFAETKPA